MPSWGDGDLSDLNPHLYRFPKGYKLNKGERALLYIKGKSGRALSVLLPFKVEHVFYWGLRKNILNDTGLLHAHTMFSDGSGTPEEAYRMAKSAGLQFFAVTEHNHKDAEPSVGDRGDKILIATNPQLYNGTQPVRITRRWKSHKDAPEQTQTLTVKPLIMAAKEATDSRFVALYGQEFSTISSGNHVNVFGYNEVLTVPNGNYKRLYSLLNSLPDPKPVVQLNHPDVHEDLFYAGEKQDIKKKMFNDYGIRDTQCGPHFKDLLAVSDDITSLIEVLSGPALTQSVTKPYRYPSHQQHENDYYFYLCQGYHISPTAGQDNHYKNWGTITDARTGVYATSLTYDAIMDGLRHGRTFATEDKNLRIEFEVNGQPLGSRVKLSAETDLQFRVKVTDPDTKDKVQRVELYHGAAKPELSTQATKRLARDGLVGTMTVNARGEYVYSGRISRGVNEFYYVKVVQEDGDRA